MQKLLDQILKGPLPLVLVLIGLAAMIVAAAGFVPVIQPDDAPQIANGYRVVLCVVAIFLVAIGVYGCFLDICSPQVFGTPRALKGSRPIPCEGELKDLYVGDPQADDHQKIVPMGEDSRVWSYELSDVELKTCREAISLAFKAAVLTRRDNTKEHYESHAEGPFVDGVGYLRYSFKKVDGEHTAWLGTMVLRVPRAGLIHGFWVTTNVYADTKFPMGTITLKRKV